MRAGFLSLVALNAASILAAPQPTTIDASAPEVTNIDEIADLAAAAYKTAQGLSGGKTKRANTCDWSKVRVRREWNTLSKNDKKAYIKAVKCLQSKPAKGPTEFAAGAKTRFDDWVSVHLNQTGTIHYTGNFLSYHRYYTWLYEEALRNECGYKGTQPYWDWSLTAISGLNKSSLFDGSDTSLSGDGESIGETRDIVLGASSGLPPVYLKTGNGGGCVTSGPFKEMSVNLGPAALDLPGGEVQANPRPLDYNPRCLKRDLGDSVNRRFANATSVLNNIVQPKNVYDFQMQMQGVPGTGDIGIHGGGHYALGGDPGRDVYTSPGDPAFYLHHSMIDRVWWIWQMLDPKNRINGKDALAGTNTFLNMPPSADTTFEDNIYMAWLGPDKQIKDLMSTQSGPFCYVYL
ncbi:tyrosinase [Fusarium sporotrichioides]|uniref:Tyrosinase n=1 Tax=Fusarium sporotrichioides TaxID=5514 RepID=A0A395S0C6_FUSSP|nr:tyrosinase [Fusarium sporotrichioides]